MNAIKFSVVLALCIASVMAEKSLNDGRDKRFIMPPYYGMMGSTSMMYPGMMPAPIMTRSVMTPIMTKSFMPMMPMASMHMMPAMTMPAMTMPAMTAMPAMPAAWPAMTMPSMPLAMPAPLIR